MNTTDPQPEGTPPNDSRQTSSDCVREPAPMAAGAARKQDAQPPSESEPPPVGSVVGGEKGLGLEITPHISDEYETCWRCYSIGVPTAVCGIAPGTRHMRITTDGKLRDSCCMDCFERLAEEIKLSEDGEEWKGVGSE